MKFLLIILLLVTGVNKFQGQNEATPMEVKKSFWNGVQIEQHGEILTLKEAQNQMEAIPLALKEIKKARTNHALATSLGFIGGVFIGWPLGAVVAGGDPEWAILGAGIGIVAVSIPISYLTVKKRANRAVLHFNEAIGQKEISSVSIKFSGNGIGFVILF